ncbi:cob(I)yrinic acid a,c-diamide adenosyltransferase [Porphyromonadaceae bacterium]
MAGFVHVYTGDGKGKTTAAFGLALRAAGAGKRVFIAQFVKSMIYSEVKTVDQFLPNITVKQYGLNCFLINTPDNNDMEAARKGLEEVKQMVSSGEYDMVVLDEATIAVFYNLISSTELIDTIKGRNPRTEIVVTGRYASSDLIEIADLVTEMKEVKHYYRKGIESRVGIEC